MDADLTQLWYELRLEMQEANMELIVDLMDDMVARLKGGNDYA
jgi:hypothetical protein